LRTLCGLSTDEIARGFLVPSSTMGHRLVRAKKKIREARIPYQVPPDSEIGSRLEAVLLVIYLVFNEVTAPVQGMYRSGASCVPKPSVWAEWFANRFHGRGKPVPAYTDVAA